MYLENKKVSTHEDNEGIILSMMCSDPLKVHMTGDSIDKIYKNGVLVDKVVSHNLVVNSFLNLVMCLLKQQEGYSGLQYWAIGSGADSWDGTGEDGNDLMPEPEAGATRLTSELGRVALVPTDFSFLNDDYTVSEVPTHILQISHVFTETDCNGVWREFGLFGGNATTAANSGILINKRHHKIITKTSDIRVERIMRFTLNLS